MKTATRKALLTIKDRLLLVLGAENGRIGPTLRTGTPRAVASRHDVAVDHSFPSVNPRGSRMASGRSCFWGCWCGAPLSEMHDAVRSVRR